jgi:sec-independent protein translocase protein TatA
MKLDPMLAIFSLGGTEIILILGITLLLFGGKKLPELAKGLGQGIREFKKATKAVTDEVQNMAEEKPAQKIVSQPSNPSKARRFLHGRRLRNGRIRRGSKRPGQNFPRTPRRLSHEKDHPVRGLDSRRIRSGNYF